MAVGEIDQARRPAPGTLPLGDAVEAVLPELTPAEVRTLLAKFGLKADQVASPVDRLSPGERTRAALALLQARGVNLLVLDEPTNHLDLPAIEQLEEALDATTARCCWSPTTAGCWTTSASTALERRRRPGHRSLASPA